MPENLVNKDKKFTHLHLHTWASFLDGKIDMKPLMKYLKKNNMDSVAITDHGVMYGVVDFYRTAKQEGIHPVIGCEVYVAPKSRFDKKGGSDDNGRNYHHLVLLAETQQGYKNLCKLVSLGFSEGMYYKPRIDKELLREYSEGIIATSACLASEIAQYLINDNYDKALESAKELQDIFGKDNFFIELQNHFLEDDKKVNTSLIRIANEIDAKIVVTNDSHFLEKDDYEAHDVMLAIQMDKKVSDPNRLRLGTEYYVKTYDEMVELFKDYDFDIHQALKNTHDIAHRCQVEFEFGKFKLPHFPYDKDKYNNSQEQLEAWVMEGLTKYYLQDDGTIPENVLARYKYELDIVSEKGFVDYYLLVGDYVRYAKENDIYVGPGRGSGAGSLLAYAIGITDLDPLPGDLLFERFLNPERNSVPDFDVDFEDIRRKEVMDYIVDKYGEKHVANIMTLDTAAARSALRDVAKAYEIDASSLSKLIPKGPKVTLEDAYDESEAFRNLLDKDAKLQKVYDIALQIEGMPRHASVHAAGMIVADEEITEYAPTMVSKDGRIAIQFNMKNVDDLGLVKVDILGLKTLTEIHDAINSAVASGDLPEGFTQYDIPLDDNKTYRMLGEGKTSGVFQFESAGMAKYMRELKPDSEKDLTLLNAAYRPGPMDNLPTIVTNKFNPENIEYPHPLVEELLEETFGIIVYQEQVMRIFQILASFSLGRADVIRKAMGKKDMAIMDIESKHFIEGLKDDDGNVIVKGTRANGIEDEIAFKILEDMKSFAEYAFNKPHANAYARLGYITAWLKANHPTHHFAALLTSSLGDTEKLRKYTAITTKEMGIKLMAPDINRSSKGFVVHDNKILFGLNGLVDVGETFSNNLIAERDAGGPFASFYDFVKRMRSKGLDTANLRALVLSGAFDAFERNRKLLEMNSQKIVDFVKQIETRTKKAHIALYDVLEDQSEWVPTLDPYEPYTDEVEGAFEKEITSLYISHEPLDNYQRLIGLNQLLTIGEIRDAFENNKGDIIRSNDRVVSVIGVMEPFETRISKNQKVWAFTQLESDDRVAEIIMFSNTLEKLGDFDKSRIVCVKGTLEIDDEKFKIVAKDVLIAPNDDAKEAEIKRASKRMDSNNLKGHLNEEIRIESYDNLIPRSPMYHGLYLAYDSSKNSEALLEASEVLKEMFGKTRVIVYDKKDGSVGIWTEHMVDIYNNDKFYELEDILGKGNVKRYRKSY